MKKPDNVRALLTKFRLRHVNTGCLLRSHNVKAPITSYMNEVSCYGNLTLGDSNDHWKVEIVDVSSIFYK